MKTFEQILEEINASNKDSFKELTLVDTSSFLDLDNEKINVYVYSYGMRFISIKTVDSLEVTNTSPYMVMEAFAHTDRVTKSISYEED